MNWLNLVADDDNLAARMYDSDSADARKAAVDAALKKTIDAAMKEGAE